MHTAVSRAVAFLQDLTGKKFPPADTVLHGYLHFEALTEHEYKYSCVTCGDYPPVVIMDLHKKGVFQFSGMFIENRLHLLHFKRFVILFWCVIVEYAFYSK